MAKAIIKSNTDWIVKIQKSNFHDFLYSLPEKEILLKSTQGDVLAVKADIKGSYASPEYYDNFSKFVDGYKKKGFRFSLGYATLKFFRRIAN
jgi:hypothetical protein